MKIVSTKQHINTGTSLVQSSKLSGAKVQTLGERMKSRLVVEMIFWSRCCKYTIMDHMRNESNSELVSVDTLITTWVSAKQLLLRTHVVHGRKKDYKREVAVAAKKSEALKTSVKNVEC